MNSEELAQAFAENKLEVVKAYVQTFKESDPELYEVLTKFDKSMLIEDELGEHYEDALAIDTRSRKKQGDERTKDEKIAAVVEAFTNPNFTTEAFISEEDGKPYVIEELLRDPNLITEDTPADVIHRKNIMYPTKSAVKEIPAASSLTDEDLEAMALAHVRRNLPPVIPMDVASRSASPELLKALEDLGAFETNIRSLDGGRMVPIHRLQYAGSRDDTARKAAGTGPDVRAVMLGDKVRNINPITGASLGRSFIEDGVRVRPNVHAGHRIPHKETEDTELEYLTHEASNLGAELASGNLGKSGDNRRGVEEDNLGALLRAIRRTKGERDLKPFVSKLMARAQKEKELRNEWMPLIRSVESELQ